MNRFIDQLFDRAAHGENIIKGYISRINWDVLLAILTSPLLLVAIAVCWPVGYIAEYRENKRNNVQTVR